jgi:hypothetical protein
MYRFEVEDHQFRRQALAGRTENELNSDGEKGNYAGSEKQL